MGVIQDAIDLGKGYLDRLYTEYETGKAFVRDYMTPPLYVTVQETGEIINAGESKLDYVSWPLIKYRTELVYAGRKVMTGTWSDPEITRCQFTTDRGFGSFDRNATTVSMTVYVWTKSDQETVR
ncbi:MAG: hypothetical protein HY678_12645, partial [Chloroflexi bacterium]|nr:hypothetical protein [Chloroflexota bacterium]